MPTKAELEKQIEEMKASGAASMTDKPKKTRTVKLPKNVVFKDAGVMVGVDPTYPSNIAVWECDANGQAKTKSTGEVKKPKRVKRNAMLAMLNDADKIRELCEFELPTAAE